MSAVMTLEVNAVLDNLESVREMVDRAARMAGLSGEQALRVELVVEEAFLNIVHHAYHDRGGPVSVTCDRDDQGLFRVTFHDQAAPFEPMLPLPLADDSISSRAPGGVGVTLILRMTRSAVWRREADRNTLILAFDTPEVAAGESRD